MPESAARRAFLHHVADVTPQDISYNHSGANLSRRTFTKGAVAAAILAGLGYAESNLPFAYAQEGSTEIPPALVIPNIDGRYTPIEELKLTPLGEQLITQEKKFTLTDEWFDSLHLEYNLRKSGSGSSYKPELCLSLKRTDDRLHVHYDAVSELEVGSANQNGRDGRQAVNFLFNTNNTPMNEIKPGTEGVYFIEFHFNSPESLVSGGRRDVGNAGSLLKSNYFDVKWSISESPRAPTPHIQIEASFDSNFLTKYSKTFFFRSYANDSNNDSLIMQGNLDLENGIPIPETDYSQILLGGGIASLLGLLYCAKRSKLLVSRRSLIGLK